MMTDERLAEIEKIKWCGEHGFIPVELIDEIKQLRSEVDLLKRDLWTAYLEVKRLGYRLMKYEPVEDPMPGVADAAHIR